jgi:hypothetical protein
MSKLIEPSCVCGAKSKLEEACRDLLAERDTWKSRHLGAVSGIEKLTVDKLDLIAKNRQLRAEYDAALRTITDMQAKFEAVSAENEALKADAERYQWLRGHQYEIRMWSPIGESNRVRAWLSGKQLDDAIDAALRGEGD